MWRGTCGQHPWQGYSLFHPFSDVLLIFDREGGHAESPLRGLAHWPQLIFDLANRAGLEGFPLHPAALPNTVEEPHGEALCGPLAGRFRAASIASWRESELYSCLALRNTKIKQTPNCAPKYCSQICLRKQDNCIGLARNRNANNSNLFCILCLTKLEAERFLSLSIRSKKRPRKRAFLS